MAEYLCWPRIKSESNDVAPSTTIGSIWRTHILDTKNYFQRCYDLFHRFIDYDPTAVFMHDTVSQLANTHIIYVKLFGEITEPEIWDYPPKKQPISPQSVRPHTAWNWPQVTIPITDGYTVRDLKQHIAGAHGEIFDRLKVIMFGKVMQDGTLLQEYMNTKNHVSAYITTLLCL